MTPEQELEAEFPGLKGSKYKITSDKDIDYNCIAWAAGYDNVWWEPLEEEIDGYFWPESASKEYTVDALIEAYGTEGYQVCSSGNFEPGYERIAIFGKGDEYTHASRQILRQGMWTSKMGKGEDIAHDLDDIEGNAYGQVVRFLRRPIRGSRLSA